ncbi:T9SS type A sorting domain-containing protein [candidate division KSB1 bacterium]|nr:T9SS type A sorting domain-containing protein [candidate division KSB1 bacterium]
MKTRNAVILFVICAVAITPAQYLIQNSVICNGAGVQANHARSVVAVVGQPVLGKQHDETVYLYAGYLFQSRRLITDVHPLPVTRPETYRLQQNYPNPFNPLTTIEFAVARTCKVAIKIYDIKGREVATIIEGPYQTGAYKVVFNAARLPTGVYFYRMQADQFIAIRKAMLVK